MEVKRQNILFGFAVCVIIAAVVWGLVEAMSHRLRRDAIVVQFNSENPVIALTFDDGPDTRYTPGVLDILYEQQVPATFFLVGEKLEDNKLLVREMVLSGHEIGNHTFSHKDLTTLNQEQIQQEIWQTDGKMNEILPDYFIKYVRPPYGHYTEETMEAIDCPLVLWTIDSGDWDNPDAEKIYHSVADKVQDGDIIVFHDDNEQTGPALEKIITDLKKRNYQFATVSQLYELKGMSGDYIP